MCLGGYSGVNNFSGTPILHIQATLITQHHTLHNGPQLEDESRIWGSVNTEDNPFSATLTQFSVRRTLLLYYAEKASSWGTGT